MTDAEKLTALREFVRARRGLTEELRASVGSGKQASSYGELIEATEILAEIDRVIAIEEPDSTCVKCGEPFRPILIPMFVCQKCDR
jgi:hypothetical protein